MKSRIEESSNFDTIICNNPIELLKAIKLNMYHPTRAKYEFVSATKVMLRLLSLEQEDGESLLDYTKRFKQAKDILKSTIGDEFLDQFMERTTYISKTDTTKKQEMKKQASKIGRPMCTCKILIKTNMDPLCPT